MSLKTNLDINISINLYPDPKVMQRPLDQNRVAQALADGLDPVLAKIIAARPFDPTATPSQQLSSHPKDLDSPDRLADIDKAVERIVLAICNQEVIGIETDHDCDGQTSHAVIYEAFVRYFNYPKEKIRSYIGHRLNEGYGLSESLTNRIIEDAVKPSLIITADNGSSDEKSIARLKSEGIEVIVTDHHEIPQDGIPQSAVAVLNPTRPDCAYPDRSIAGCMVAWLLMTAVRKALMQETQQDIPKLGDLLDFVAVGTIADCVSIAKSKNNRIVVSRGLQLINLGRRPCWQAIISQANGPMRSEDLGFKIGPLLNSDGRLACAFGSVSFLLAENIQEAREWIAHLTTQNIERKAIQDRITRQGIEQASLQYQAGKSSLCLKMDTGHAGVHGISASRIKDMFGRPTVIFCPKKDSPEVLTGSARSVPGLHLKHALQRVYDQVPDIFLKFGGHEGAAGLTIFAEQFACFEKYFEQAVNDLLGSEVDALGPVIWTDGELSPDLLSHDYIESLMMRLEPFGREFEPPQFEAQVEISTLQYMGQAKNHARLGMIMDDLWLNGVWFFCREDENAPDPIEVGDRANIVYVPKIETFRGQKKLVCMITHCEKVN